MESRPVDLKQLEKDLAGYSGKVLLVHHFATWCEPCKDEIPILKEEFAALAELDFVSVAISWDLFMAPVPPEYAMKECQAFLKRREMEFDHLLIYTGTPEPLFKSQGITAGTVPFTDVRGSDGAIVAKFPTPILEDADRARLKKALTEACAR